VVRKPDSIEDLEGSPSRGVLALALDLDGGLDDVFERSLVAEEVEALENHADVAALAGDVLGVEFVESAVLFPVADEVVIDPDASGTDGFQMVHATQKCRLPRSGRADEDGDFALTYCHVDPAQDVVLAEVFVHAFDAYESLGVAWGCLVLRIRYCVCCHCVSSWA